MPRGMEGTNSETGRGQLGDGRAITLGEVDTGDGRFELQLKGSGTTLIPDSRTGRRPSSSLGSSCAVRRCSILGVPTTRALSLVSTGEDVIRDILYDGRPAPESGAIVCRVAPSFLRFGSFQIHANTGDFQTLRKLVDFTVAHHFPSHSTDSDEGLIEWLKQIADETALMISHWMRVGFVHGVMNTDNMSIHGLTIDYGPYGWLENYDPDWTPNTTDARTKRYRFGHQARIGKWNYARLLEAISPLMSDPEMLYDALEFYDSSFQKYNDSMWAGKLGIAELVAGDEQLVTDLTTLLQSVETDMTIFFRMLSSISEADVSHLEHAFYDPDIIPVDEFNDWLGRWWTRATGKPDQARMRLANPKYVLRNWMAQLAIDAAEKGDTPSQTSSTRCSRLPMTAQARVRGSVVPEEAGWARHRVGCSMLSCSS